MEQRGIEPTRKTEHRHEGPRRSEYTPAISNRSTVVTRSGGGPYAGLSRMESQYGRQSLMGSMPSGQFAEMSSQGVTHFKEERTQEKADMQDLNNRLASYMEKMRYYEAMNKALEREIEKLKKGKDVDFGKIKNMYEDELKQARKVIEELSKDKADTDVKLLSLEDELNFVKTELDHANKDRDDYKNKADRLGDQIGDLEGEVNALRFRVQGLEDDLEKALDTIKRHQNENDRLRRDLDTETVAHINEANRAQGLEEELAFITQVYEQEIKELQELAKRDTTIEMRDFWKGEMGGAMRDIQSEYDSRLNQISNTLESKYNVQLNQISASVNRDNMELNMIKDDNKKLHKKINDLNDELAKLKARNAALEERNRQLEQALHDKDEELDREKDKHDRETNKLKDDLEGVLRDMQQLIDAKLSLELEIAAYRKLLECEEGRFDTKSKLEDLGGFKTQNEDDMHNMISKGAYTKGPYNDVGGHQHGDHWGNDHGSNDQSGGGKHGSKGGGYNKGPYNQGQYNKGDNQDPLQKSESTGKLTINRTSRGGITFADISPDGKCITITNNGKRGTIKMTEWRIERKMGDMSPTIKFTLPFCELAPTESVFIYAVWANHPCEERNEILAKDIHSWGMGQAETTLWDINGAEKASHKQAFVS